MEQGEIDLRSILGVLRRQIRLVILCVVLITGGAGIYALSLKQIYSATALIMVDPSTKNLLSGENGVGSTSADNARIDSEVEILRSDSLLLKVIQAQGLISNSDVGVSLSLIDRVRIALRLAEPQLPTAEMALDQAVRNLRSSLSVQRRGNTYLLAIQASSPDPSEAARIANAVAEVYIQDQLASKINGVLAARDILQSRIDLARQALIESEGSFDTFVADNMDRIVLDSGRSDLVQMQEQIAQLEAAQRQTSSTLTSVQESLASEDWQTLVSELQSEALAELNAQRSALVAQIEGGSATGSAQDQSVDLAAQLERIEKEMRTQSASQVSDLRSAVSEQQTQQEALRQDLRSQVLSSSLSPDTLAQLYELQQTTGLARNQYQLLLTRSQELDTQATLQIADSRIVSPALQPQSPSFPNHRLILMLAALAGIGIGVGLAFLYENFIGGFTSEEQAASVLKVPVATSIPRVKGQANGLSVSDLVVTSPLSMYSEAIRRIRSTTDQILRRVEAGKGRARVVMVASSTPNEGKTTISLSLARSYAQAGHRVLLVDCDLRKPSVHRHLGLERSEGLYEFLNNEGEILTSINSIVSQDPQTSATVIVGARQSMAPTDQLLSGTAFPRLIDAARNVFDIVILDTPPLGPVVDGLYLASHADAVVFVTRFATTSQAEARRCLARLEDTLGSADSIVAVINQQDSSTNRYLKKYGGYYQSAD